MDTMKRTRILAPVQTEALMAYARAGSLGDQMKVATVGMSQDDFNMITGFIMTGLYEVQHFKQRLCNSEEEMKRIINSR